MHLSAVAAALAVFSIVPGALADVTVYFQAQQTMVATGVHNTTKLTPPALPNPMPPTNYFIQLQTGVLPGASIQLPGSFFGFSIEMSVANQVLGHNSSLVQVPFLNLMQNIVQRAGTVHIRVGGNTQDFASVVPDLGDGRILEKDQAFIKNNPTQTPPVLLSHDFLRLMRGISAFTNVRWYLGIPFNDTNFRLEIVDQGEAILGEFLLGFQAGNEPDFYAAHQHRGPDYGPQGYLDDLKALIQKMSDPRYDNAKRSLIAPSIANSNGWTPGQVWDTGMVDQLNENLKYLAVERYPTDNCAAVFPDPKNPPKNVQEQFPSYLTHQSLKDLVGQYAGDSGFAQSKGKPFLMFETNTASCGGFPGISDSFGASLWSLDYALQLAHTNFSGAMFHVGGQRTFYNPFTAPPTNETRFHQWTVGPTYYSALVMAEIMGPSNTTQVLDLNANNGAVLTPAYAIFENGQNSKLALFNYMDDASGGAALTVTFAIGGSGVQQANGTPQSVRVKYLQSGSVADNDGNFKWAGQTFGTNQASDGRLQGTEDVQTVNCNPDNTCAVKVPSPGFALVFLNYKDPSQAARPSETFSTSSATQRHNTATIAKEVLATSNGHQAVTDKKFSTSIGSSNAASTAADLSWMTAISSLLVGMVVLLDLRRN